MVCWWFLKSFLGNLQVRIFGKEIKKAMVFFHGLYFLIGFQARRPFQELLVQSDMSVGHWDSVSIDKHMHDL
jgi:hypothetical protein